MRIVVIGGGEIGLGLARRLGTAHEIVVVDLDAAVAERVASLDVRFLGGNGTNPDVLRHAGVDRCEVLVAATGMDEVNVLASLIANRLGSPQTICVISRDDLLTPLGERDLLREHFGIDRVVWPEAQLAEEIERLHVAVQTTLKDWVVRLRADRGADFPEHVTAFRDGMAVHGRYGKPCPVCGTAVQRIRYASNETNYCPRCQTGGKLLADRSLSRLLKSDWPRTVDELEKRKRERR